MCSSDLAPIVDAVGHRVEVLFDSGIRTGMDIMKAMALGASGTMVGRAYVYGLGAGGEAGVTRALEILKSELDVTMGLCGERDIGDVGRHNLLMPAAPFIIPPPASARPKSRAPAKPRRSVG